MKTYLLALILPLLVISTAAQVAPPPAWVSQPQTESGPGLAQSYSGNDTQGAYKALLNWNQGFMEFQASATCDLQVTVNTGQAESLALRGAKVLAYAKAAEFLNGMMLSDIMTGMDKQVVKVDIITAKSSGFVKSAVVIDDTTVIWKKGKAGEDYPWATVKIGVLLYSNRPTETLMSLLYDNVATGYRESGYQAYQPNPAAMQTAQTSLPNQIVTGLIIDARGKGLKPTISPLVLVQGMEKKVVFSGSTASKEYALKTGLAGFAKTEADAKANDRLKKEGLSNPLMLRAVEVKDNALYLTPDDAAKVAAADVKGSFLQECRVVILVD